ncbi:MAG: class I SAM-dependent RNA methyltransferase [Xanthobacteraceae bacterium]|nr:class I SAM-dependent RNA methyltransferase [Xanthobacteraceae bacterium]
MTERLTIDRLAHRGDGVADTPGGPVFVPYTLPGETVEAERVPGHPDRRHLLRIDTPSPERIAPICPHFGVCGGCAIQHWTEARYREWKRELVAGALRQAGLDAPVGDLIDAHGEGRRRAVFHARRGPRDVLEVGFATLRAHHIVGIDRCPVLAPSLDGAIKAAWAVAEALAPERKPLDIQVTASESGIDMDVRGSGPLSAARMSALAQIAGAQRLARLTRHGELIAQRAVPTVTMGKTRIALPPGSFLQATAAGEATLAQLVASHIDKAKVVADLFCGLGPFALRLAERARVAAFDSDQASVAALKAAAAATSGLKPVEAEARDLFRRPLVGPELKRFDAVVFDPPRQGAEAQSRELAKSAVPAVIAVSCNPATFARDAGILVDGGYRLTAVTPVDQFRHSAHVEIVARLSRR